MQSHSRSGQTTSSSVRVSQSARRNAVLFKTPRSRRLTGACWLCEVYSWGARCSSAVRAFAHGVMGHRIDPSWGGPIKLFLVPAGAPQLL